MQGDGDAGVDPMLQKHLLTALLAVCHSNSHVDASQGATHFYALVCISSPLPHTLCMSWVVDPAKALASRRQQCWQYLHLTKGRGNWQLDLPQSTAMPGTVPCVQRLNVLLVATVHG